jgi:type VI secretion system protein ImpM
MFGYYGKLPAQGDFERRRADVGFVQGWDDWLQAGFAESREKLADRWQLAYENAPIWRFCFGAKVCGPDPMIGVMMPSQDRVGRCFPLTVFYRLKVGTGSDALEIEPFMASLEEAALGTLEDGQGRDRLDQALDEMTAPELPATAAGDAQSYWLSTFFAGHARIDRRSFTNLPASTRFTELLNPDEGALHV